MEGDQLERVALNKMGHFYTDKVQLVYYAYKKQSTLYTRTEGMLYVWIGAKVKTDREKIVQEALKLTETIGIPQKIVSSYTEGTDTLHVYYLLLLAIFSCLDNLVTNL